MTSPAELGVFTALSCAGQHERAAEHFTEAIVLIPLNAGVCAADDLPRFQAMVKAEAKLILEVAYERLVHYAALVEGWDTSRPQTHLPYDPDSFAHDEHNQPLNPDHAVYVLQVWQALLVIATLRGELSRKLGEVVDRAYAASLLNELAAATSGTLWHYFTEHQIQQEFPELAR